MEMGRTGIVRPLIVIIIKPSCKTSYKKHQSVFFCLIQGQERLAEGTPLPVSSERDIFHYLGLDYLEPHERDW